VTIKPGGPDISPAQVIAGNGADVVVNWMPDALAAREAGVPLVNIAQVFDKSGLMLTCKKSSGVTSPKDFKGKTLGVWFGGNEYPFLNWMAKLGNKPDTDIKVLKQGFNVDPLLQNQAACISTMIYNEYWQVVDAGVKESDLVTFFYEERRRGLAGRRPVRAGSQAQGPGLRGAHGQVPEGQLQGLERRREETPRRRQDRGGRRPSGSATVKVQKRQMENVAKLITNAGTPKIGYLEPAPTSAPSRCCWRRQSPVIKKDPGAAAMSHVVWEAAAK
jgi:NitT/TauT family transport system substrate-binding protein